MANGSWQPHVRQMLHICTENQYIHCAFEPFNSILVFCTRSFLFVYERKCHHVYVRDNGFIPQLSTIEGRIPAISLRRTFLKDLKFPLCNLAKYSQYNNNIFVARLALFINLNSYEGWLGRLLFRLL